jgi:hypothetical protein
MNIGVKKSAKDVTIGIKKLLGSLPFLNMNMELINNSTNIKPKRIKIVIIIIDIINNGFTISIPVIIPNKYPKLINATRLSKIVTSNP